ncbi:fumarylacetoacetate hydrolase family protein [Hydrogenophaga sp. BPS33]|uniref:fumarylacetoacetate hydrolase family protein n=1 Tax=Hydrogenophaga sp. BPS33 TaxID=2651974 RepID=UPI0013201BD9|nr:fumarylacetoacetate hydrolase family protein [Hydrogenophaga sp. BPS33]QHE86494.1 fumarylacetoacetate hydrolase family protein [Hydrogenophaga sp. BPS33]
MQLASFEHDGRASYGLVGADGRHLPAPAAFQARFADLKAAIAAGELTALKTAAEAAGVSLTAQQVRLLPVIPNPGKLICVGLNYKTHVAETKRADSEFPSLFLRFNDSLAAHGETVLRPSFSERFDWEGELAFVIGKGGRHIAKENAFEHIAGYACFNDVSVRDWQRHTHQFTPGKNFPGTGPFGPFLATRDEVPDVTALQLQTRLNGQVVQNASVGDLIFDIPTIVAYISRFTPLSPGDVIATGTPGGVGDRREPPLYMKEGDVVEVEITGLGILRNPIGVV